MPKKESNVSCRAGSCRCPRSGTGCTQGPGCSTTPPSPDCSFCGKSVDEVALLVAGPMVYICDECIDLAAQILTEHRQKRPIDTVLDRKAEDGKKGKEKGSPRPSKGHREP